MSLSWPIDLGQGTYEGLDQLNIAKPLVKAAYRVNKAEDIPTAVARAYRAAVSGRPGGVYLDVTTPCLAQIVDNDVAEALFFQPVDPQPAMIPSEESVTRALQLLSQAKKPVILLGKGAAQAQVEGLVKEFVEKTGIPFYPMSMAKGILPDKHPLSALSVRSTIMAEADVVILVGARLNWLLSRGKGKWNKAGKFIQLEIDPVEIDCNRPIAAPVVGDLRSSLEAMLARLSDYKMNMDSAWVPGLQAETKVKNAKFLARLAPKTVPMTHWSALGAIMAYVILVNEGANTLDDTRVSIDMSLPRHRIDCATWAIMGMGMGSAIGAAVATGKSVVAIEGDSAFGRPRRQSPRYAVGQKLVDAVHRHETRVESVAHAVERGRVGMHGDVERSNELGIVPRAPLLVIVVGGVGLRKTQQHEHGRGERHSALPYRFASGEYVCHL